MPTPIRTTRSFAPGDLLGGQYQLHPPGLCRRRAHLRGRDQEISQVTAGVLTAMLKLAQSLHGDGPEIGRLHHAWPHQDEISRCASPQTLTQRRPRKTACANRPAPTTRCEAEAHSPRAMAAPCALRRGAVAVSGGGDSLALMHLLAALARRRNSALPVVLTVDHGLRKASANDARQVARWAKKAGLKAHILTWRGKKPKSGIEALAREARYRLMGELVVKRRHHHPLCRSHRRRPGRNLSAAAGAGQRAGWAVGACARARPFPCGI